MFNKIDLYIALSRLKDEAEASPTRTGIITFEALDGWLQCDL